MKHWLQICFFAPVFYGNVVNAQSEEPWSINFFLENDLFANTDLNYTNGLRLSSISPELDSFQDPQGQKYPWVEKLGNLLEFVHPQPENPDADSVRRNMVVSLGQLIFTPTDRARVSIDTNDRPYAGYLYLGVGYHARTSRTLHSTEFNFGIVGPAALARQSQNLVHKGLDIELFQGWHNQLKNEMAFQLIFERKHKLGIVQIPSFNNLQMEIITHWGASVGNVASYVNAGAEFRLGWSLPEDFGTSTLRPGGDNNTPGTLVDRNGPLNLHAFIAADSRLVGNNIFLDGNTFKNSHSVERKDFVADLATGVAGTWKRFRFSYAHIYRTREFRTQSKAQFYGSFSLSYMHNF